MSKVFPALPVLPSPLRRVFLQRSAAATGLVVAGVGAPSLVASQGARPALPYGLQLGDTTLVAGGGPVAGRPAAGPNGLASSIVWARSDKPARMVLEWDTTDRFANARRIVGPYALEATDFTARVDLTGLPAGQQIFTRVAMEELAGGRVRSEWLPAQFRTPSADTRRLLRFVWGGDTAGQNFGINPEFGGMRIYDVMRQRDPDFFVHCGDTIYADGPMTPTVQVEGGRTWRNLIAEGVQKVAETQDEFRGRYRYNLLDDNVRRFSAQVPQLWQWDDHEVTNNWSDGKDLTADNRYTEKSVPLLTARASKAFLEYAPLRPNTADESERVYRKVSHGPMLDVFMIDMRSYRGQNSANDQATESGETTFLGNAQIDWLVQGLRSSRATWKIISADMPLGLVVPDGKDSTGRSRFEAVAQGNGAAQGRELEMARLLSAIKRQRIRNVVWITADVHYCAAHYYDPNVAQFRDFDPFWEFVAGPLNAGSFGPNPLDDTFGPQVVFQKAPPAQATSPLAGFQFFGEARIDPRGQEMTVAFIDIDGKTVFERTLQPTRV